MRVSVELGEYLWRPLTDSEADSAFVVRTRSDPRFAQMFYSSITADQHKRFIQDEAQRRDEINWMIERRGERVGVASIYHLDRQNKKAECGRTIMLEPKAFHLSWIVSAFVAFDVMQLNKLWIETIEANKTIARAVERLGMTREGLLRWHVTLNGQPTNVWYFGGTRQGWDEIRAARFATFGTPRLVSFDGWKSGE